MDASCKQIDDSWGPYAGPCRGGFDFTLLFEESILSILPTLGLLLLIPFRVLYLLKRELKVHGSVVGIVKPLLYASLLSIQIALVALWAAPSAVRTRLSIVNAVIILIGYIGVFILSHVEHHRTIAPSLILNVYLFITILFDIAHIRTLWLQPYNDTIAAVTTVWLILKLAITFVEALGKEKYLRARWQGFSPEAYASFYNKAFFCWENRMFWKGYSSTLTVEELYPLDKRLTSHYLYEKLQTGWDNVRDKSQHSLLIMVFYKLGWDILYAAIPRLAYVAFQFCQPFLVNRAISLSQSEITPETTNVGYGLIGAYIVVYVGIAVSSNQYQHMVYRAITLVRGGLVSMLFAKTPTLKSNDVDPAASMTLMSADIERIWNGWQMMHEIWANSAEIGVAIFLLYLQVGAACVMPVAVAVVSFGASVFMMTLITTRQALWLEAMERRISATTKMLGSMKRIKMCGLTEILFQNLQRLREQELEISKKFRRVLVINMTFAFTTQAIAPVLTFAVYSVLARRRGEALTANQAFTSLSLFALLAEPLASLIISLTQFVGSVGCFTRIQAFLQKEEHNDERIKPFADSSEKGDSSQAYDSSSEFLAWSEKPLTEKNFASSFMRKALLPTLGSDLPDAVSAEDTSFGWDSEKDALIKPGQFKAPQAKLTLIVGPVGCGKTTMLKSILGEVPALTGKLKLQATDVSYCDQTPFHMNGTIKESIISFAEADDRWYSTVIEACALDEDLRQLPLGEQTRIGSKGIALSGGQSQRLALARAVYTRADLCILDDVFSGLDLETENRVFHNLLGLDGLFRRQGTTVILASSASKRIPYADHVIVLNEEGAIEDQGTFKELIGNGGYISTLDLQEAEWSEKAKETKLDYLLSAATRPPATVAPPAQTGTDEDELEANRRTGDISIYIYYARAVGVFSVFIFMFFISGYVFAMSFPQVWLDWWTDANAEEPNKDLGYYIGIYALLGIGGILSLLISCWKILIDMVPRSGSNFHFGLLKTVLAAPMSFFSTTDTGITLNRFSQDLQLIDMELPISALNFFTAMILCLAQIVLIGIASKYAAISFPLWFVILYFVQKFYLRTSRQLRFLDIEAKAPLYSLFSETLEGLTTVRAFGWQKALERKSLALLDYSQKPFYLLFAAQRWLQLILDLVVASVATILMVLVVELRGILSGAYVGIALLNVILFSQHLKLLFQFWTMLETHIGAITRVKNFVNTIEPEEEPDSKKALVPSWPEHGAVEFQSVFAGYDSTRMVLKNLSMSIQAGEKIGICGRTGSGKSSMVLSIFSMIDMHGGSILVDGVDLATIPRHEVRSRIVGLPQDVFLLSGSVRLNLDPYGKATDAAIANALEEVKLWKVVKENGGLDADIDSVNLSHGQRQLLCLAQALLRRSSILVLDEATSSVDDITDKLIQKIIRQKFASHTIIAVAHKLDTILDFDKVAVLDNGTLREFDNPHALLARPASAFRHLYNSSVGDGLEIVDDDTSDDDSM